MSSHIVFKTVKDQAGRRVRVYLSTTGRWIKSAAGATVKSREQAAQLAAEHGASTRVIRFRN